MLKKEVGAVTFNIRNFIFIRNQFLTDAAKVFLHLMIPSHFSHCITSWSQAGKTILRPLHSFFKSALKIFDFKKTRYHHCHIIKKYSFLLLIILLILLVIMYKINNNLAPPAFIYHFLYLTRLTTFTEI